jgi:hypothetical protein
METKRLKDPIEEIKKPLVFGFDDDLVTTATTPRMQVQGIINDQEYVLGEPEIPSSRCPTIVFVGPYSSEGGEYDILRVPSWRKYFWCAGNPPELIRSGRNYTLIIYEALEEDIGFPGDAIASMSPWPKLWQHAEPEPKAWRGVFFPTYSRKVLFSKTISFRTAELPRWKPQVLIDRRTLARKDG